MKNKMKALLGLLLTLTLACYADVGEFQITCKVVDESGKPMPNVNVGASYMQSTSLVPTANTISEKQVNLFTEKDGQLVINSSMVCNNYVYCGIKPVTGYYSCDPKEYRFEHVENGKWQPWNPTAEFVLKPIGVRVPMYAKKEWSLAVPEDNKSIGYDLELGDWVAPYGKGITSDFIFTLERKFTSITQAFDATLTLTFHNDGDGIQSVMSDSSGSALRIPRTAPEDGYEPKLTKRIYRETDTKPIVTDTQSNQNYFFRVRTKKNDDGKIISALYGKIEGDIEFWPNGKIRFQYYLNSKLNSRAMEFDPRQNLFKNLPPLERAIAP